MIGANQTSLATDNFKTTAELGWNAGLQVRGAIYNDFSMIYAINFFESNFSANSHNTMMQNVDANYKLSGAQLSLLLSYNIIQGNLSVEVGPMLQVNGKLAVDESDKNNILDDTTLQARDVVNINPINFNGAIGITGGVKHVRLSLQYLFGISNMLNNLNDDDLATDFNGHIGMLTGNIVVFL